MSRLPFILAISIGFFSGVLAGAAAAQQTSDQPDVALSDGIAGGAIADTCGPHRDTIVRVADQILADRVGLSGFSPRNYGSLAVYLKLRQQDMGLSQGMALLNSFGESRRQTPRHVDGMRMHFAIAEQGVDAGLRVNGETAVMQFAQGEFLTDRQIILMDAGKSYFRLLAAARADAAASEKLDNRFFAGMNLAGLLLDQSDEFKLTFAKRAIAAGEIVMAGMVLGSRTDLAAYYELAGSEAAQAERLFPTERVLTSHILTAQSQDKALYEASDTAELRVLRDNTFAIVKASALMSGMSWLSILYNQTGEEAAIARASRVFIEAVEAGKLHPETDMEAAWIFLLDALEAEMGAGVRTSLNTFDIGRSIRHYAGRAAETLDWMTAILAFEPYLRGERDLPPARPTLSTNVVNWAVWSEVAEQVLRRGSAADFGGRTSETSVAVELLYRIGDVEGALAVAGQIADVSDRLSVYRDLIRRLDQRCDGFTTYPGAAIVLGGMAMMTFPPK